MSARTKRSKRRANKRWYANLPSACLALVPVDASETRATQRALYASALKDLGRQNRRAKAFLETDLPSFRSWSELELADGLKQAQQAMGTLYALQSAIAKVQDYASFRGISEQDAYRYLEEAKKDGREEALWQQLEKEKERERGHARQRANPESEEMRDEPTDSAFFRNAFGPAKSSERYLKSLYRQLVRKLHPDITGIGSEMNRSLWQEVQEAYAAGDLETLQRLLKALNDGHSEIDLGDIPIGDIVELRRDVERRLFLVKLEMRNYKTNPAWNFSSMRGKPGYLTQLKAQLEKQMKLEASEVEQQILDCETQIASWQRERRAKKKRGADW